LRLTGFNPEGAIRVGSPSGAKTPSVDQFGGRNASKPGVKTPGYESKNLKKSNF
jgi:hypothetical protein